MKNLILLLLFVGIGASAFAAKPYYDVKKESIDIIVKQDVNTVSEIAASVDLNELTVTDFSEGLYLTSLVYINDNVAGIKTSIENLEYLYIFKINERAKLKIKLQEVYKREKGKTNLKVKTAYNKLLNYRSGIKMRTRIEFLC